MTEQRRRIEARLWQHRHAGRELVRLAEHMPHKSHTERIVAAQKNVIDFILSAYGGNAEQFLTDYKGNNGRGIINAVTIVQHVGRTHLGLGPEHRQPENVYG